LGVVQAKDVQLVTLSRFGWVNKPFEVIEDSKAADGSIELTLQATDPSIWNMDAGFSATPIAPNTSMPVPWGLPLVTNLAATSGDATLLRQADGTSVPQILVTWDPISDSRVLQGGYVEIRYWRMGDSGDTYSTIKALGTDTQAYLPDVRNASQYVIIARTASVVTQSGWASQVFANGVGKTFPPTDVAGASLTVVNGLQHVSWTAATDVDYLLTEIRSGTSWAAGTVVGSIAGKAFDWTNAPTGAFTLWLAHKNRSGVYSNTPVSVTGRVLATLPNLFSQGITTPHTVQAFAGVKFNSSGYIAYRGGSSSSTYADSSTLWGDAAPPGVGYKIRFDQLAGIHVSTGAGTPSLSGSFGSQQTLNSSTAQDVILSGTNVVCDATITWTLYDSTGANQLATGMIKLEIESTD